MRVLVVTTIAPFVWGGAEHLATNLTTSLETMGYDAELLRIPFQWNPPSVIPSQMALFRSLDAFNVDRVIALKFPAYLVRHDNKVIWLIHQYRQAYDLFGTVHGNLPDGDTGDHLRRVIFNGDCEAFGESRAVYTISDVVSDRLHSFNGIESQVLRPPLNDADLFTGGESERYIFCAGRINAMKRQHDLIAALSHCSAGVRLVIAGPADRPEDEARLRQAVEDHGVADRVHLDIRFLTRMEYVDYMNNCSAVAYIPVDEDAMSYVAAEAAEAGKPVITATDSGGILALVKDGLTGWVVEPEPHEIAGALVQATDWRTARERGDEGRRYWRNMGVTWENTVQELLK